MSKPKKCDVSAGQLPPDIVGTGLISPEDDPPQAYRIVRCLHGVLVDGTIPVPELLALSRCWIENRLDLVDAKIAERLGVSMCFTNAVHSLAWRKELEIE